MARRKLAQASYWPAYVDAVLNVVLNILFLVAVFAVALGTMPAPKATGDAAQSDKVQLDNSKGQPSPAAAEPGLKEIQVKPLDNKGLNVPADAAVVQWSSRTLSGGHPLFVVDFLRHQVVVPAAQQSLLKAALSDWLKTQPQGEWAVWSMVGSEQEVLARNAYLRTVAVRELLLQAGVAPERLNLRLLPSGTPTPSLTVYIGSVNAASSDSLTTEKK